MRSITPKDWFLVLYYYHFPILNHFRNLDQIFFSCLILNSMEDSFYKARKKKEEGKPCYLIHQGFMNKLYNYHLVLSTPLLVNPLATITPQILMDPCLASSHKKIKKAPDPNVKITLIDSYMDMRKSKWNAWRTRKHLQLEKIKSPPNRNY